MIGVFGTASIPLSQARPASPCLASLLAIAIAIDPFPIAQQPIFLNKIASASEPGQHG